MFKGTTYNSSKKQIIYERLSLDEKKDAEFINENKLLFTDKRIKYICRHVFKI